MLDDIYSHAPAVSLLFRALSTLSLLESPGPRKWLDLGTRQLAQRLWNISRKGLRAKLVRQTLDTYRRRPPLLICLPVLVTGPSVGGIGAETALSLAAGSPACIILAGRSLPKIQPLIHRISGAFPDVETHFVSLDLSSLRAIRDAAADISQRVKSIDILINNAAIMACPFAKTVDGIESQFGTNYVGHFLLTNMIMNRLIGGQGARIVNVSSSAHQMADVELDDWNFEVCMAFYYVALVQGIRFTDAFKDGSKYKPWIAYVRISSVVILPRRIPEPGNGF